MCALQLNKRIEAILAVEIRPEKIRARTGFEPMTSAIPVQRSTY